MGAKMVNAPLRVTDGQARISFGVPAQTLPGPYGWILRMAEDNSGKDAALYPPTQH
jgi:hypothetical protein